MKKVLIVFIILILLLFGVVILRSKPSEIDVSPGEDLSKPTTEPQVVTTKIPTQTPIGSGSFLLEPDDNSIKVGEKVRVDVFFQADGYKISGGDVILHFDPEVLQADTVLSFGDFFTSYPRKDVDNTQGVIKITGIGAKTKDEISGKQLFASVNFQAKRTGRITLTIDFLPGRTNLSNLVERGTSRNILGSVKNIEVVVEP